MPGADFGAQGEGYIRFCFARDRRELTGALESMAALLRAAVSSGRGSEVQLSPSHPSSSSASRLRVRDVAENEVRGPGDARRQARRRAQ